MSLVESFNPYESPQAKIVARPGEVFNLPAIQFSAGAVLAQAWTIFQARMGLCIGIIVVGGLLNFGLSFAQQIGLGMIQGVEPNQTSFVLISLGVSFAVGLFNYFVNIGQTIAFLKIARGEPTQISDIFTGGPFLLKLILATIVVGLVTWLGLLLGVAPGGILMAMSGPRDLTAIAVLVLGLLAMGLVMSAFWVRISQYMFAAVDDPDLGVMGSIRRSIDVTRGQFWGISLVYFLVFLINIVGLLMLGIGLLFTIPLSFVMFAVMYVALAGRSPVAAESAPDFLS